MSVEYRFTREILIGALCHGFDLPALAKAMRVTNAEMFAFSARTRRLSEKQATALERVTGITINELALRGVRATGDPVKVDRNVDLFDASAEMFAERRAPATRQPRAARRRQPA